MSVRARIEDAKCLWDAGRYEGAAIMVLVAVDATVQKRYPQAREDRTVSKAYKQFIREEVKKITNGPTINVDFYFRGNHHRSVEDII